MDTQTTLSITDARKNIFQIVSDVEKTGARYTLTEKGKPKAVILSADEFDSWLETMEVMRDIPTILEDIKEAKRNFAKGDYLTLDELLKINSILISDKKGKYEISRHRSKKSAKGLAKTR